MGLEQPEDDVQLPAKETGALPCFSDWLSSFIGFKVGLPAVKMPQTLKNFDRAAAMIVLAAGENLSKRITENTKSVSVEGDVSRKMIRAGGEIAIANIQEHRNVAERAEHYATNDLLRKQTNREAIFALAAADFSDFQEESGETISEDWLAQSAALAENKSEPDVQAIWAKIIAGEIRQPGRFPLRFLAFFSTIDHALAVKISAILSYSINDAFIFYAIAGDANQRGDPTLLFDAILEMEEAGILSGSAGIYAEYLKDHSQPESDVTMLLELRLIDRPPLRYRVPRNEAMMGGYPLTQMAKKLLSIIKPNPPPETYIAEIVSWSETAGWRPVVE